MSPTMQARDFPAPNRAASPAAAPDRVYADLRERIVSLELPPGTTLGRSDIAQHYGVSQTPVREALQRLEEDGLVQIFPQSKTVVSQIDVRQLYETQFLRVAIETEVVRRLALTKGGEALKHATAILRMQQTLLGTDETAMFSDLDRTFHRTFFDAVGMVPLHLMLLRRLGHLYRCQRLELPHEGRMEAIVDAHQAIIDGIASGYAERAAEAMRQHLSGTISRVPSLRASHPDYFTGEDIA